MLGLVKLVFFSIVNISEGLDEDDNEDFKILNEFLNTSDEASVSPDIHRYRLETFIHQKKIFLQPQIIGCLDIFAQKPFST